MRPRVAAILFTLPAAVLLMTACAQESPAQKAWHPYSKAMKPVVDEYEVAMYDVGNLDIALTSGQKGPSVTTDQAVQKLEQSVIPALDKAASDAQAIRFEHPEANPLAGMHDMAVKGLALKADAYKTICSAYKARNPQLFEQGVTKLKQGDDYFSAFRRCFTDGILDDRPPVCNNAPGQGNQPAATAAASATPNGPPIPGLPPIPGQ